MVRAGLLVLLWLAACGKSETGAPVSTDPFAQESCEACHARINPGLVADHRASPHTRIALGCEDCHGTDHDDIFRRRGEVSPAVCKECHEQAYEEFARSRHGTRLREGKMDALLDPAAWATGGCTATSGCHSIQRPYEDGTVGRCGACHITHAFRNAEARDPRVCTHCHEGPDNPQHAAWLRSAHALPSPTGKGHVADCVACHGTHDVSGTVVHGLPPVADPYPVTVVTRAETADFERARAAMLERCKTCHVTRVARAALAQADIWRNRGAVYLEEAARIVRALDDEGLLQPAPRDRVPNVVAGHALRLGGAQVFDERVSLPERIYYEMHFHLYPALWRAAYHNDPERLMWYANDAMKAALDRLRAVADDLRRRKGRGDAPTND